MSCVDTCPQLGPQPMRKKNTCQLKQHAGPETIAFKRQACQPASPTPPPPRIPDPPPPPVSPLEACSLAQPWLPILCVMCPYTRPCVCACVCLCRWQSTESDGPHRAHTLTHLDTNVRAGGRQQPKLSNPVKAVAPSVPGAQMWVSPGARGHWECTPRPRPLLVAGGFRETPGAEREAEAVAGHDGGPTLPYGARGPAPPIRAVARFGAGEAGLAGL
jgi:hypothetical protein